MSVITTTGLSEAAKNYQKELRFLPYGTLVPELSRLGISMMQVANIDVKMGLQRKGAMLKPYSPDQGVVENSDLGKFTESELKVETSYSSIKDHIKNYQDKKYINPTGGTAINQTKEHPLERLMVGQKIIIYSEDILDSLYHGKRDVADRSPLGAFTGYETKILEQITASNISEANKNLIPTGAIVAPLDENDVLAIRALINFVRAGNAYMRRVPTVMHMTEGTAFAALDALGNAKKYIGIATMEMLSDYINSQTGARVTCIISQHMGTGSRLIWTVPGNLDFGMNTFGDYQFVQIRSPFEDPNFVQFWIQSDQGCRIVELHQKVFATNEQVLTPVSLSGDYTTPAAPAPPAEPEGE